MVEVKVAANSGAGENFGLEVMPTVGVAALGMLVEGTGSVVAVGSLCPGVRVVFEGRQAARVASRIIACNM